MPAYAAGGTSEVGHYQPHAHHALGDQEEYSGVGGRMVYPEVKIEQVEWIDSYEGHAVHDLSIEEAARICGPLPGDERYIQTFMD